MSYTTYDPQYVSQYMQRTISGDSGYVSMGSPVYPTSYEYSTEYKPEPEPEPSYSPIQAEYSTTSTRPVYPCLAPSCNKAFNRAADMGRHVAHVHRDKSAKDANAFSCDYSRCQRNNTEPFYRKDHFRDHLRDYHKEDIGKRVSKTSSSSSSSRGRGSSGREDVRVSAEWWRCSKCLVRNKVPYWDCSGCGQACERDRQQARLKMS